MDDDWWWRFVKLCARTQDPKVMNELFELLFTISERREMAGRLATVKALLEGKLTQREIARDLHVSIAKITRGSNELKEASKRIKEVLIAS